MTTQALENLARARAAHVEASTALDQAAQANSALLVRAAEARAKIEEAVREAKTNGDPTGKWAMQLRLATDDQNDIQGMLNGSQALLNERNAAMAAANQAVQSAELEARHEEAGIHARELDAHICELEAKFCEAIQARLAVHVAMNPPSQFGSKTACHKFYAPSRLMHNIVARQDAAA
ncbi:hypothetical protein [Paraburkholderia bryophila]|uniref:DNA repair exonuclease SbcCD ATPase subunit n=1 Tax=Paraburkholderia bryophila TaxID=420952 RepID=A0A7Y9WR65_9BURK|nr:hypothetical protein [Paraburkholderia bryophila]NYH24691.1 DNA repair exonuclease SbcCD ATPase subunit [Paraburkholderia bryophila]